MMCGICGTVSRVPITDTGPVERMREAMRHRGPDGAGTYRDTHVALAMRRLSIIDLTRGWQPLYNEDRTLVLIANAEIYNFLELRDLLTSRGHAFATGGDCETIVHLYEEYGVACVQHLRGMFAFALWDENRRRLLLARDRMGEKPMYLYEQEGRVTFASELKALLQTGAVPFELDPAAVHMYFHYAYVPEPRAPVTGVRKLPAGCTVTVDVDPWRVTQRCFWRMEDAPPLEGNPGKLIRDQLETVSELVIRADVPVGVALSGGLDSSAIAALAARKYSGTMHAFSVGYPNRPTYDERDDARSLADRLGMAFHEVELTTEDMVESFPELVRCRDDPIADIAGYGYYCVAARAREQNVPVLLQGQGGDELFWGYPWTRRAVHESLQREAHWRGITGKMPVPHQVLLGDTKTTPARARPCGALRSWARSPAGSLPPWQRYRRGKTPPAEPMAFYDLTPDFLMARSDLTRYYTPQWYERVGRTNSCDPFTFVHPWPRIDLRVTRLICDLYLRENGIAQGDRLSMASSVELRLPLVDYRLVETVIGLRKRHADYRLTPKAWLKEALKDVVPEQVMNRPKQGFAPPLRTWHRALFDAYGSTLPEGYLVQSGILSSDGGRRLAAGPFPDGAVAPLSFKALVLEVWCRSMTQVSSDRRMIRESVPDPDRAVCV